MWNTKACEPGLYLVVQFHIYIYMIKLCGYVRVYIYIYIYDNINMYTIIHACHIMSPTIVEGAKCPKL